MLNFTKSEILQISEPAKSTKLQIKQKLIAIGFSLLPMLIYFFLPLLFVVLTELLRMDYKIIVLIIAAITFVSTPEIYYEFGFDGINYGFACYLLFTVFISFLSPFLGFFSGVLSRRAEYRADCFAAENGYGDALVSALKKLAKNSYLCLNPHPLLVALTSSHPTVSQRIAALEKQKRD